MNWERADIGRVGRRREKRKLCNCILIKFFKERISNNLFCFEVPEISPCDLLPPWCWWQKYILSRMFLVIVFLPPKVPKPSQIVALATAMVQCMTFGEHLMSKSWEWEDPTSVGCGDHASVFLTFSSWNREARLSADAENIRECQKNYEIIICDNRKWLQERSEIFGHSNVLHDITHLKQVQLSEASLYPYSPAQ